MPFFIRNKNGEYLRLGFGGKRLSSRLVNWTPFKPATSFPTKEEAEKAVVELADIIPKGASIVERSRSGHGHKCERYPDLPVSLLDDEGEEDNRTMADAAGLHHATHRHTGDKAHQAECDIACGAKLYVVREG